MGALEYLDTAPILGIAAVVVLAAVLATFVLGTGGETSSQVSQQHGLVSQVGETLGRLVGGVLLVGSTIAYVRWMHDSLSGGQ